MRRHEQWLVCLLVCLAGCMETDLAGPSSAGNQIPVQFTLDFRTEVLPFPALRSIPDFSVPEPSLPDKDPDTPPAPDGEHDISELCARLEYLVYPAEETDTPLKHKLFTAADADMDFGIVYDSLPAGDYRFVFIAHSSEETELSGEAIRFDEVSDTFYAFEQRTVSLSSTDRAADVSLRRAVCRIEFIATDPVTADLKDFEIRVSRYPAGLHMPTGQGMADTDTQAFLHTFTPEESGKSSSKHSFYTFIPPDNGTLDIQLTARDREGKTTRERTLTGIVPLPNRIIRYSGRLYAPSTSNDTFRLEVYEGGKWEATDEVELPD